MACASYKGFGSAVGMLGSATTYIIGPMVVSAVEGDRPIDPYMVQNQIMRMLYVCKYTVIKLGNI